MARMAGGSVVPAIINGLQTRLDIAIEAAFINPDERLWGKLAIQVQEEVEIIILEMQKDIFNDLAWQHEAYLAGGIQEMTRLHNSGDLTTDAYQAWLDIDNGIQQNNQSLIWQGNVELLKREQQTVLGPSYAQLAAIPGVANVMSQEVKNPYVSVGGGAFTGTDVTSFTQRWNWITTQMVPMWQNLTQAQRNALVDESYSVLTGTGGP